VKISRRPLVIGHRGASAEAPENTVAAFTIAAAQGADWVELDVRLTTDSELAVVHDAYLPDGRIVADLARSELPHQVPVLAEALAASVPMGVNVEIKHDPVEPGFADDRHIADITVAAVADSPVAVLISSFDLLVIDRVRHLAPELPTAYLVVDPTSPLDAVDACVTGGHSALHPWHKSVDAALVDRCHEAGLAVNVWTVDDPDRIRQLAALGVDGIVTNHPAIALEVLGG
jgi:glycerophosphoryl diester phosphodiesterase